MALIIDTDIGSDIDDAIALAYVVKSGMDVKLITTVHGPTLWRARLAKKLTMQLGVDIPVAVGSSAPTKQKQIFSSPLEESGDYVEKEEEWHGKKALSVQENGIEALAQTISDNKHNVTIAAIGPLTNLGTLFQKYPEMAKYVNQIYVMGNAIVTPEHYFLNYRAYNLKVDPEAADIIFASGAPITIVTTEICKKNYLSKEELESLKQLKHPAFDYIADTGKKWLNFINYEQVFLYDPLVVQHYLDDKVTEKKEYGLVRVTTGVDVLFKENLLEVLRK